MCKDTVNVRIRKRLTIGLVVSTLVMALLMIGASVADKYAQKNNITIWRGVSPRDPDPKYCEFMPIANVSNSTLINNTRTHIFLKKRDEPLYTALLCDLGYNLQDDPHR